MRRAPRRVILKTTEWGLSWHGRLHLRGAIGTKWEAALGACGAISPGGCVGFGETREMGEATACYRMVSLQRGRHRAWFQPNRRLDTFGVSPFPTPRTSPNRDFLQRRGSREG